MSLQEYIFITISIIYGLAISRLLTKVFGSIRHHQFVQIGWPAVCWSLAVTVILIWFIWIGFKIQMINDFGYAIFIYLLITTTSLFGAVEFSYPDNNANSDQANDIRWSALFVTIYLLTVGASNYALANASLVDTLKLTGIGMVLAAVVMIKPNTRYFIAPLFLLYALLVHSPLQKLLGLEP